MATTWFENITFALVMAVLGFALGAQSQPDSFASRFAPALSMQPSMAQLPFTPASSKGDRLRAASVSTSAR